MMPPPLRRPRQQRHRRPQRRRSSASGASRHARYEGAYNITNTAFTTGGSVYEFILDAVESIPDGVNLEMTFTQKM
jgi:hypothetical protein